MIKVAAVAPEHRMIEAPAFVADSQEDVVRAFEAGELNRDVVVVVRFQGPRANGMPELHRLTAILGSLQSSGYQVALITDGRMSGASGRIPAAIHLTPEAAVGGPVAAVVSGDVVRLDVAAGTIDVLGGADALLGRPLAHISELRPLGLGRDLFAGMRANISSAEEGACTWLPYMPTQPTTDPIAHAQPTKE